MDVLSVLLGSPKATVRRADSAFGAKRPPGTLTLRDCRWLT
jgi:hypothetical protein